MRKIENSALGRISVEDFKSLEKNKIVLVADNIRSQNNVGSIFRSSDAFAVSKVYLCGITATPPNREIHKTALGAELSVEWEYSESTEAVVRSLRDEGYLVAALEQVEEAVMLNEFVPDGNARYAIVVGNEVDGVAQNVVDLCDFYIEIPQFGTKHSLNVSVATGVVLWHMVSNMK